MLGRGLRREVVGLVFLCDLYLNLGCDRRKLLHRLLVFEVGVIPENAAQRVGVCLNGNIDGRRGFTGLFSRPMGVVQMRGPHAQVDIQLTAAALLACLEFSKRARDIDNLIVSYFVTEEIWLDR